MTTTVTVTVTVTMVRCAALRVKGGGGGDTGGEGGEGGDEEQDNRRKGRETKVARLLGGGVALFPLFFWIGAVADSG